MPDVDIFIDSSFFAAISGTNDISIGSRFEAADNIGLYTIIVDYKTIAASNTSIDIDNEIFITNSGTLSSGIKNVALGYQSTATISGSSDIDLSYRTPTDSGTLDIVYVDLAYYATSSGSFSDTIIDTKNEFSMPTSLDVAYNISTYFRSPASGIIYSDYEADYTAGGEVDPLISGSLIDQFITYAKYDISSLFTKGATTNSGSITTNHEVFFAGYPMTFTPEKYTYRFHLVAGDEGISNSYDWESTVISGAVLDLSFDAIAGISGTNYIKTDSICGVSGTQYNNFYLETISGTINHYYFESICGVSGTNGIGFDIDLFSLKISNFSLDIAEYGPASGTICVDITDDVYNVVTSGTYFIIDGVVISGTNFYPIIDGYRMCYDSPTEFEEFIDTTEITVHGENDNGDSLEVDFYVTSGYIVEFKHRVNPYDYNKQVVVRGTAENNGSCPTIGTDAYWFTTVPRLSRDLGAIITGIPYSESNLSASITPTTETIFFYGKTFRIEVRAKDFAGNVMTPYIFEFKIEDMPE